MQSSALIDLLVTSVAELAEEAEPAPALVAAFVGVPDPRRDKGAATRCPSCSAR